MGSSELENHFITCPSELQIKPKPPEYFSGLRDELKKKTQM
jgi:hypothetical protein